jgi:hypothetical protein
MLCNIDNNDETECRVLVKKYISMGFDEVKIRERLRDVDEKFSLIYDFPSEIRAK